MFIQILIVLAFISFVNTRSSVRGLLASMYTEENCKSSSGKSEDVCTDIWYVLDKCFASEERSSKSLLEGYDNGTLQMTVYQWNTVNCTGEKSVWIQIAFGSYGKCANTGFGEYTKIEIQNTLPETPSGKYRRIDYESMDCTGGITGACFQLLNHCIYIGTLVPWHAEYTKNVCKVSDKEFVKEYWETLANRCITKPKYNGIYKLGECEDGEIYDCKD